MVIIIITIIIIFIIIIIIITYIWVMGTREQGYRYTAMKFI